jgi:hypothetical protein
MKRSTHHLLAALLAGLFGLFLTYGSLTSTDFVRGIYGQPNDDHWAHFDSLHPNRVWNYSYTWGGQGSLAEYLAGAGEWNIKPFLRLDPVEFDTFYLEYYSCGQHHTYEAELDYDGSSEWMENGRPDLFYFFHYAEEWDDPVRGDCVLVDADPPFGAWKCTQGAAYGAGVMLQGPNETAEGDSDSGTWTNQLAWPNSAVDDSFRSIIRVMADLDDPAPTDTIFYWRIYKSGGGPTYTLADSYYTAASFSGVSYPDWKQFELDYTIPDVGFNTLYTVDWWNECDFWVDWIEFYDINRGRYLFEKDAGGAYIYRAAKLAQIEEQCDSLAGIYGDTLAGWKQSDEPLRSSWDAHGIVNIMAGQSLQMPAKRQVAYCEKR